MHRPTSTTSFRPQRTPAGLARALGRGVGGLAPGRRRFGRQAFVGLAGPWGTLTLGRQYTMLYWSILDADVMGPRLYGTGSLDVYIPSARTAQ